MMLVCSSGKDCQIRKDWPSQRCPDFKLCQGYVIEKTKKHKNYEHMGDAKDFLEMCLLGILPIELIQIVYEYFGPGTVVFDGDKVLLMNKINKHMDLPVKKWKQMGSGLIIRDTMILRNINRSVRIGRYSTGCQYMEIHYWMFTNDYYEVYLRYNQWTDYATRQNMHKTTLVLPSKSHHTRLMALFGPTILKNDFCFPPLDWDISFDNDD